MNNNIEKFDSENAITIAEENPNQNRAKIYKCKDCNKEFDSCQALGGHRSQNHSSFKQKNVIDINETSSSSSEWVLEEMENPKRNKMYKCKQKIDINDSLPSEMVLIESKICNVNPKRTHGQMHKCKDCNKEFDTHQGLGGHRSKIHPGETSKSKKKIARSHVCKICKKVFESGRSLGGHMRIHYREKMVNDDPCSSSSSNKDLSSKVVFEYDLNLTPLENEKAIRGKGIKIFGFDLSSN